MKYFTLLILAFIIFGCSEKNAKNENYVTFENLDTLGNFSLFKDNIEIDSLIKVKFDSIVHTNIIIDSTKFYVVEGDLLLNEYEYTQYKLSSLITKDTIKEEEVKLVGEIRDNKVVKWAENYVIKFCIVKNSFQTLNHYNTVKENFKIAINEWENTCNIKFYYDEAKDEDNILSPAEDLTFVVVGFDSFGEFIASAFFPYDPPKKRRILIDPTYFTTTFDKVGVIRHELGHVLGFRHEHIRNNAPKICQGEDLTGTINITEYDPKSVMHYFCGGMGDIKLEITEIDKKGSQSIYGLPN